MKKPTRHNELDLDHRFWAAMSKDPAFFSWFIAKTKFAGRAVDLVRDEKWHQRWYRDPVTGKDSETDILLMLRDATTGDRVAVHIENKPDHRGWETDQAINYRRRAIDRMTRWRYVDSQIVLIAPMSFVARWPEQASQFDLVVLYEEISAFVPEFGAPA